MYDINIEKVYEEMLKVLPSNKVFKNENMSKHISFKIGGNADLLIKVGTVEEISKVLKVVNENQIPLYIIGNGSNVLVKDNGIRGIVLIVEINDINIEKQEDKAQVTVGAGVKLAKLAYELLKENIAGFEFASRNTRDYWRSSKNECRCSW